MADKVLHAHVWGMRVIYWIGSGFTLAGGTLLTLILQASWDNNNAMGALTTSVRHAEETVGDLNIILQDYRNESIRVEKMANSNRKDIENLQASVKDNEDNLETVRRNVLDINAWRDNLK